jgi:sugar (pentulose or hexulose) kinase
MPPVPVVAIFDVGKTNKKLFLFDSHYRIVFERTARFNETTDEDGDPCENIESLITSVHDSLNEVFALKKFKVAAVNFSAYGASFVCIGGNGTHVAPLYNYLKPYPEELQQRFYSEYGGVEHFAYHTASPVLGSLNSGMQLYRLKYSKPEIFAKVKFALHLPQYLRHLVCADAASDITSVGCHTNLWDFTKHDYHEWVYREGVHSKLAPLIASDHTIEITRGKHRVIVGSGLHDSSAALIPYLMNFTEPFALISTGTWSITLNPFNHSNLTKEELRQDCLCYLSFHGKPVKASRLFAGNFHEEQIKRIADHFGVSRVFYRTIEYTRAAEAAVVESHEESGTKEGEKFSFHTRELNLFRNAESAYYALMSDIVNAQVRSTSLVVGGTPVKRIFVDGGFSGNSLYMQMLANRMAAYEVFAASMAQATAIGTALAIHKSWNPNDIPGDIIELRYHSPARD